MLRRAVFAFFLAVVLGSAQTPGTPVFTKVDSLACGVRLYTPTQIQTWCYVGTAPSLTVVHNTITTLTDTASPSAPAGYAVSGFSGRENSSTLYYILWLVSASHNFQVTSGTCACLVPQDATSATPAGCAPPPAPTGCTPSPAPTPPGTLQ